jgi:hypothetical protein
MHGGEEVPRGFVVAGCDGAELFEFGEEVLDQVPGFIEFLVVAAGYFAIGLRRDHRGFTGCGERREDPIIGVERLVGKQGVGLHRRQKVIGADQIVGLAAGEEEADRVAEGVDQGVDLRAQPAARTADRLVFADFFLAPALC